MDILNEIFSHVRVKKKEKSCTCSRFWGVKNESNVFVFSLSFSMDSSLNQFFVYWKIFVCFWRPLSQPYRAIEITSKYFPLSCS